MSPTSMTKKVDSGFADKTRKLRNGTCSVAGNATTLLSLHLHVLTNHLPYPLSSGKSLGTIRGTNSTT